MKRTFLRPIALGIATLTTVAGLAVGAVSSQAATNLGQFTITPGSGVDAVPLTLDTPVACDNGTNFQIYVSGAGFPAVGYGVTANNTVGILPGNATGGYTIGLLDTMKAFAAAQVPPATLAGTYTFTGQCKTGFTDYGTFTGSIVFTQNGASAPTFVANNPAVPTTTALGSSPASPVNTGAAVAFTAHVAAPSGAPVGTVQLLDGTTAVGSPTAVDASGNAVISTAFTTAGTHSITAAFTAGAGSGFGSSDSSAAPLVYTVNQAPADATTTALSISPASGTTVDSVTLTAAVSDNVNAGTKPTGTVQFADGGTALGAPVALSGGTAAHSQTYAAGAHSFTATYIPSNAGVFAASASTSQAYSVTAFAGVSTSEDIKTTIASGSLILSVADSSSVVLPNPTLNATATYLTTSGKIHAVTIADTRAGNPGWNLNGQVSDFTNTSGPTTTPIVGANLGWTPNVIDQNPGQTVVAGPIVLPATAPVTSNAAANPAAGLHTARQLASAAAGAGTGTAHVDALLALNVPTTVVAGTYDATLTLTAI